jgi:Tfp pilus assembly protein PilX
MIKQVLRDESGVALGIAIMVMVIVGVMGAGLLVFVRNDLEAVIEVNQGQRAFDIADAGAQVAKQQILGDKVPAHYDVEDTTHPDYITANCNTDANDPDDATDTANDIQRAPSSENWAPDGGGQTRSFADGQFTVTIRWLTQDPLADPGCRAPKTTSSPVPGVDYFKVISTGKYRDATRRIEAIYETYSLNVPQAYYTPGKINIAGTACIDSVSLFTSSTAIDAIDFDGGGGCSAGGHIQGPDLAYGDWNDPPSDAFNTTPRTGPTCTKTLSNGTVIEKTCAGVAAVGGVKDSTRLGSLDYDSTTNPKFVVAPTTNPQSSTDITFPFNLAAQPDPARLCDEAKAQGNYEEYTTTGNKSLDSWPDKSNYSTVVCKVFKNVDSANKLIWSVGGTENLTGDYEGCKGPIKEGTLVIRGGNFSTKSGTALLRGVVVIRGPEGVDSDLGTSTDTGNTCLDGFVNASGTIKIAGKVKPSTSLVTSDRPGFYGVKTWGWRELYQ